MISATARSALEATLGGRVQFDAPMARHTSLRLGGPADALATPNSREELKALLGLCSEHGLPHHIHGAGFNTVIDDAGVEGVVIRLSRLRTVEQRPGEKLFAEAGASHNSVTKYCTANGVSGLEFGAGIPGSVGGWIAMNAGIGVREVKDAVLSIEVVSTDGGCVRTLPRPALDFRYRALVGLPEGAVIVSALFAVTPRPAAVVKAEVDRLLARRAATQPLNVPSCGSVFKNPEGDFAGRLIEAAGLKGTRRGGAEISSVHANFIVNVGGATAGDVIGLVEHVRDTVEKASGIRLEPEVQIRKRLPALGGVDA